MMQMSELYRSVTAAAYSPRSGVRGAPARSAKKFGLAAERRAARSAKKRDLGPTVDSVNLITKSCT